MSSTSKLILKLSCLVIPYLVLSLVLHDTGSGGIGGGGYDLSGLVYGSILFTVNIVWLIWMFISFANSKTAIDKKLHFRLLLIGSVMLVAAWFITPSMV